MQQYKQVFDSLMGIRIEPNNHEVQLFARGQKYIQKLSRIPGIEMIAIVNSLSMYATHKDSDIDLFIITKPGIIWFVRFFCTLTLWKHGVWRKGEDIAGNLCLSFFITTDAIDLSKVAIENDIYLYYWIYYMKPIFIRDFAYEQFLIANNWVEIDEKQKIENQKYSVFSKESGYLWEGYKIKILNQVIRFFLLPKTIRSHKKLGNPEGVIISDTMLKFHDGDMRKIIRDTILKNNFDK